MRDKQGPTVLGDPLDDYHPGDVRESESGSAETGDTAHSQADTQPGGHENEDFRARDTGLGQPDPEPDSEEDTSRVSREEIEELRQEQEKLNREFQEKLLELERTGIRIPRALYRTLVWAAVFLGAILGLFLVTQGVRFAGQVSALTMPWNVLAGAGFALFTAAILVVVFKLAGKFLAFRRMDKIDLKALNLLAERRRFRQLAEQKKDEAKPVLLNYLQEFQIPEREAEGLGMDQEAVRRLKTYRQNLLDKQGYTDSSGWIQEFQESFMHVLDGIARKRIRSYSRNVALGTAASPIRFVDQLIVLYSSLKLISDLMQIYNLRPAFGQSATVLARSIIQAYLSGVIGEHSEAGVDTFAEYYQSIFGEISFASGVSAATDATRFVLPKVSEGALNGFLLWRLGKQAQGMLRPV